MLIVLDNARNEQQVRPLLPASPASLVIVTSRNQLTGLAVADGASVLTLDVLSHDEAVELLSARIGASRATAEPEPVDEIARMCAHLPLALTVAAARAVTRPRFPLTELAADLREAADLLDALDLQGGDPMASVRAVFSWSYRQLSEGSARLFRLLGLHPGPDISVRATASLAAVDETEARRLLRELTRDCLITEHTPGRYAFHDLLRAYAAERTQADDSQSDRDAALNRILDHYLHTAGRAALLLQPSREKIALASPVPGTAPEPLDSYQQAMAWFEAEHSVLVAVVTLATESGSDSRAWQLPWAVIAYLSIRGHLQEYAAIARTGLTVATRVGDTVGQSVCGRLLATAHYAMGHHDDALRYYTDCLKLYRRRGDSFGEARVYQGLSGVAERQGRYGDALSNNREAFRLYQAIGHKAGEAETLNNIGWLQGLLGDYQQARDLCREAIALSMQAGTHRVEGESWDSVGYAEHRLGNFSEAITCYERALSIFREFGERFYEALTLTHIGDACYAAGELPRAREGWRQALAILEDLRHPDADQVRAKLADAEG
jgi:tetratricopeptide (TPR) repeat protein